MAMRARIRTFTAALVAGFCTAAPASAGDGTPAMIVHANGACTACEVMPAANTRMKLSGDHHKHVKPLPTVTVNLCPGACYGYFPTQWRSWEEACGLPSTMPPNPGFIPAFPPSSDTVPDKNGRAPDPRSLDPRKPRSGVAPLNQPISRIN
jgi:hypothetical protein